MRTSRKKPSRGRFGPRKKPISDSITHDQKSFIEPIFNKIMGTTRDDEIDFDESEVQAADYGDSDNEPRQPEAIPDDNPGRTGGNQNFSSQDTLHQSGREIPSEITRQMNPSDDQVEHVAGMSQNSHPEQGRERLIPETRLYTALADEMNLAIQGRGTSMIFRPQHFTKTAKLLVDRGFHSIQAIKRMKTQLRTYFIDELKKAHVPTEDVRLVFELFDIFPPTTRPSGKQQEYEEVCIPAVLRRYAPDLSQLTAIVKPDQLMVNEISRQLTAASFTVPPYVPFVTADLSMIPWRPTGSEHKRAHEAWESRVLSLPH